MAKGLFGKLFGDRGYISQALRHPPAARRRTHHQATQEHETQAVEPDGQNPSQKRALIETVNDQLKNVCQIEHSRHRSPINAFVHLIAGLVAFTWQEKRPALSWTARGAGNSQRPQATRVRLEAYPKLTLNKVQSLMIEINRRLYLEEDYSVEVERMKKLGRVLGRVGRC